MNLLKVINGNMMYQEYGFYIYERMINLRLIDVFEC